MLLVTCIWINVVLNNWIWKFVEGTTDAKQRLEKYCPRHEVLPVSRVMGSEKHPKVPHGALALRKFLSRILYKNRCWPSSCLCLQNQLLPNNLEAQDLERVARRSDIASDWTSGKTYIHRY